MSLSAIVVDVTSGSHNHHDPMKLLLAVLKFGKKLS